MSGPTLPVPLDADVKAYFNSANPAPFPAGQGAQLAFLQQQLALMIQLVRNTAPATPPATGTGSTTTTPSTPTAA